jgi:hypothetical protein
MGSLRYILDPRVVYRICILDTIPFVTSELFGVNPCDWPVLEYFR